MTLPQTVQDALDYLHCVVTSSHLPGWKRNRDEWQIIRVELHRLTDELERANAEIERLKSAWHVETLNRKDRLIALQETENDRVKSSLAAANALLRECYEWLFESLSDGPRVSEGAIEKHYYTPLLEAFHTRIQSHLQGAGDEA